MKTIDKVHAAYSSRNDEALIKALEELQRWMFNLFCLLGPFVAMHQLRGEGSHIQSILNKIAAEAEQSTKERLAFLAGFISAQWDYIDSIATQQERDAANALLSCSDNKALAIRIAILKCCYTHIGTRSTELVNEVAKFTKVSVARVKFHVSQLAEMKLLERIERSPKAVYYRITRIGEAVLSRRLQPYEIALFCVDLAASDKKMRAAMRDEIKHAWPLEDLTVPKAELRAIAEKRNKIKRKWSPEK